MPNCARIAENKRKSYLISDEFRNSVDTDQTNWAEIKIKSTK